MRKRGKDGLYVLQNIRLDVRGETTKVVWGVKQIPRTGISEVWIRRNKRFTILNHDFERSLEIRKIGVEKLVVNILQVLSLLDRCPSGLWRDPVFRRLILQRVWVDGRDTI